tara:strand:+ start:88 stop:216 length:129 start_codon:yes stop_codon:yes gene_type:complete
MNKEIIQAKIDDPVTFYSYRMLFKGIWTGVLISLIFHHLINH